MHIHKEELPRAKRFIALIVILIPLCYYMLNVFITPEEKLEEIIDTSKKPFSSYPLEDWTLRGDLVQGKDSITVWGLLFRDNEVFITLNKSIPNEIEKDGVWVYSMEHINQTRIIINKSTITERNKNLEQVFSQKDYSYKSLSQTVTIVNDILGAFGSFKMRGYHKNKNSKSSIPDSAKN